MILTNGPMTILNFLNMQEALGPLEISLMAVGPFLMLLCMQECPYDYCLYSRACKIGPRAILSVLNMPFGSVELARMVLAPFLMLLCMHKCP